MNNSIINHLLDLRISVLQLGELNKWWPTSFFKDSSLEFFKYVFPRSSNARIITAIDIAKEIVDKNVGVNSYHLFRMPIEIEEHIHRKLMTSETINPTKENVLKNLDNLSNGLPTDDKPGPKYLGNSENLDLDTVQAMAAEYLNAFNNGYQVHPYLN